MNAQEWLHSDEKDYQIGLQLLTEQHPGGFVLRLLQKGPSVYNCQRLAAELKALCDKQAPPAKPIPQAPPDTPKPHADRWQSNAKLDTALYPEPLRPAVDRLQKLYAFVNHYHPLLDQRYNQHRKEAFEIKCSLEDAWHEIEEIWRLLQYYQDNKVILPNPYNPEDQRIPRDRAELVKRRNNLRSYISKHKSNAKRDIDVREWQRELAIIEKELEDVTF